jgi:hypothetical protein
MKGRPFLIAAVVALAFGAGWFVRGLNPELGCKAKGGFYSERIRTCIFAEPSAVSVDQARLNAKWLIHDNGDHWTVEVVPPGQMGGGIQLFIRKRDGVVTSSSRTQ